ncbi:hypothetical protein [Proteiniphilum sp.]|uniref:hypothetical protein n=1 Tax=Proteiniphilum sp. TaxID=1926877 RepID=UPI002B203D5F|nr:hypothetical protein [Proteiniphilum sp.]MEA4918116.1 hypothetical protein [Proteiniphilum sp.]
MIEKIFNQLFSEDEREKIRSRIRSEPIETMRKAWILFAYLLDYSTYDIAWCTGRKSRQVKYLLSKAEDLFSVNDRTLLNCIDKYERTLEQPGGTDPENNR